jgi:replication factor A2
MVTTGGDASAYTSGGQVQQAENPNYAHLPALERSILECIQSAPPRDEGTHVDFIAKRLSSNATINANELRCVSVVCLAHVGLIFIAVSISQSLDRLMDEGHIYSTIDDNHFMIA